MFGSSLNNPEYCKYNFEQLMNVHNFEINDLKFQTDNKIVKGLIDLKTKIYRFLWLVLYNIKISYYTRNYV